MAELSLADLVKDPANSNLGTDRGRKALRHSLETLGAGRSILVSADNVILAGNKTAMEAAALGHDGVILVETDGTKLVAVKRTDLQSDSSEARSLALSDNRIAELDLSWSPEAIAAQLDLGLDLSALWTGDELEELLRGLEQPPGLAEGADADAIPEDVETRCKPGDLWALGRHKLLCADSSKPESLAKVMGGRQADVCITSPPYNLGSDHHTDRKRTQAYPDELPEEDYQQAQAAMLDLLAGHLRGDLFYQHKNRIKAGRWLTPVSWVERGSWRIVQEVVWINGGPNMDPIRFYPQTERIYWLTREGSATRLHNLEHLTDWWQIPPVGSDGDHTRAFPVEVPRRLLVASSAESVLDPYAGSGTTLMAAQVTGSIAFAIEREPRFCDVILTRFEQATGITAQRL